MAAVTDTAPRSASWELVISRAWGDPQATVSVAMVTLHSMSAAMS